MKCKWCGIECYLDRNYGELGGGMIRERATNELHACNNFLEWEKSKSLQGPALSHSRYELWLMGPEQADKRLDLQKKAKEPLLPFFSLRRG